MTGLHPLRSLERAHHRVEIVRAAFADQRLARECGAQREAQGVDAAFEGGDDLHSRNVPRLGVQAARIVLVGARAMRLANI